MADLFRNHKERIRKQRRMIKELQKCIALKNMEIEKWKYEALFHLTARKADLANKQLNDAAENADSGDSD